MLCIIANLKPCQFCDIIFIRRLPQSVAQPIAEVIMEVWKDVVGYEGYQVSSHGRIKSFKKNKPCIRRQWPHYRGYLMVGLSNNNIRKCFKTHRLVAVAFVENPLNKKQVNHIDGDKKNNHFKNLEWVTNQENSDHAWRTGLRVPHKGLSGDKNPMAIISNKDVSKIKKLLKENKYTQVEIGKMFGISNKNVSLIKLNKVWKSVK